MRDAPRCWPAVLAAISIAVLGVGMVTIEPADEGARSPEPAAATGEASAEFERNVERLLATDPAERRAARDFFARCWPAVRSRVAALADDARPPRRLAAARLLEQLATADDLGTLRRFAADRSAPVRAAAARGIQRLGAPPAASN